MVNALLDSYVIPGASSLDLAHSGGDVSDAFYALYPQPPPEEEC